MLSTLKALEVAKSYVSKRQMVAVLYMKKNIYAVGLSSTMNRRQLFTSKLFLPSIHAEVDAMLKAFNNYVRIHHKPLHCNMLVIRYVGTSKPCLHCLQLMRNPSFHIFIHKVTYLEDGNMVTEKLSDIKTNHISRGFMDKPSII